MEEYGQEDEFSKQLNEDNQLLKNKNMELSNALAGASFPSEDESTLIHYQLETDKILERIEHFLRGDQIKVGEHGTYYSEPTRNVLCTILKDKKTKIKYYIQETKVDKKEKSIIKKICVKIENAKGEEIDIKKIHSKNLMSKIKKLKLTSEGYRYTEIIDEDKKPFNEYGVAEIMRIMSMYVTKETFLSYYEEERIHEILGDLGHALADFIYCNYERMGMNNKFKESKYIMIVLNLLHAVESCYRRALRGNEQENIRTRAIVTQSQGFGGANNMRKLPSKQKFHPLKPGTW